MSKRRIKLVGQTAVYHAISRTVNGEIYFSDEEKEVIRTMVDRVAQFSGVEVLTYCLMSNHFHILVRIPEAPEVSDQELVRRYRILHDGLSEKIREMLAMGIKPRYEAMTPEQVELGLAQGGEVAETLRARLRSRMYDLSEFMATLKQRITIWYNRTHERFGPLWSERFKSVLVEGKKETLLVVAGYIDLNPIRAGMVSDPKDYRFCGYASALGGNERALLGLRRMLGDRVGLDPGEKGYQHALLRSYRSCLLGMGSSSKEGQGAIDDGKAHAEMEELSREVEFTGSSGDRFRYFSKGLVIGGKQFLQKVSGLVGRIREQKRDPQIHDVGLDKMSDLYFMGRRNREQRNDISTF